jgi:DNA-binding beta-propeller fold protein YncE
MRRMVIGCLMMAACGRGAPTLSTPKSPVLETAATAPKLASCARRTSAALPERLATGRQGNAVALARAGGHLLAYVADADSRSIHTLAVDEHRELVRTRVDGAPRQLLVLGDGRVVATLSDGSSVAVLEPGADPAAPLAQLCTREVAPEPWGVALSADDAKLVVTSSWGSALTVFDGATLAPQRVVPLPRDPRGVLVDDDGTAFITHLVGARMSVVDLGNESSDPVAINLSAHKASPKSEVKDMLAPRTGSQGYALAKVSLPAKAVNTAGPSRVLAPMVSVDPGDFERPNTVYYGPPFDGVPKEAPFVSSIDPATRIPLNGYLLATSEAPIARECLLPHATAVHAKTASLLVACFGIDAIVELDAWALDPVRAEKRRFEVPPGPEGIAVDEASGRAVVFSQMGGAVTVIDLDHADKAQAKIALDYHPDTALADAARGRLLFYRTDDTRISNDGVACSSCHIDGREDGITWTTPQGPRQTPMLAGRVAGTAPYGWEGDRTSIADYVGNTVVRLGGTGLAPTELADIAKFLLVARPPPRPAGEDGLVARGRELFIADKVGCTSCHVGDQSTDSLKHELSKGAHDYVTSFDTPSLHFVRGTAPYFHDGRYPTLEALLADSASTMGTSSTLPAEDRLALAAYLRSL